MCSYWGMHHPASYKLLLANLVIFDEYPVENTHSIIRSKTNTHDTAKLIQKKAKVVFQSKMAQQHFKEHLTQPKKPQWSLNNLKSLKAKCANIVANIFTGIAKNPGKANISIQGKTTKVLLPKIFKLGISLSRLKSYLWDAAPAPFQTKADDVIYQGAT